MKEIKLTDNQFNKLLNNIQSINQLDYQLKQLKNEQDNMISLICEFNDVDIDKVESLNLDNKVIALKG